MPRPCQRVRLENGIKLDFNRLARRGFIDPGGYKSSGIRWTNNYTGEPIASGFITADMSGAHEGWVRIQIGTLVESRGYGKSLTPHNFWTGTTEPIAGRPK